MKVVILLYPFNHSLLNYGSHILKLNKFIAYLKLNAILVIKLEEIIIIL